MIGMNEDVGFWLEVPVLKIIPREGSVGMKFNFLCPL
jgi:hypothetical protein